MLNKEDEDDVRLKKSRVIVGRKPKIGKGKLMYLFRGKVMKKIVGSLWK